MLGTNLSFVSIFVSCSKRFLGSVGIKSVMQLYSFLSVAKTLCINRLHMLTGVKDTFMHYISGG